MKNGIVLFLVIALLSGCGNVAHRSFVPQTSFDQQSNRKKDGDIGSAVCKDDANAALCSVVCQYKGQAEAGACNKSDQELLYKLFFVEIDEQGRFYDDRQFQYLLDYLNAKSKQASCANGGKGLTIVTIVHGWRHNAKEEDSNVKDAEKVLLHTYQAEQNPSYSLKCKAREVVGVYVGWRGKSLTTGTDWGWDPLELVSIYDRKNTALNVAMGSVREILSALQQFVVYREQKAASVDNCIAGSKCKLDRLAIVGHSFGGLIVFNALSEGLLNSITGGYFVGDASVPPAVKLNSDLVILINPAIEAIKFEPIYQAIKRRGEIYANNTNGFDPNQRPVFVAITAKNDYATRGAFPFARWFSTFIEDSTPVSDMGYSFKQAGATRFQILPRRRGTARLAQTIRGMRN